MYIIFCFDKKFTRQERSQYSDFLGIFSGFLILLTSTYLHLEMIYYGVFTYLYMGEGRLVLNSPSTKEDL
jgi:hypothetical protein